jgi:multidrug resistance efflux pump
LDIARTKYNALVKEVEYYSKVVESDQKRRVTADGRIDKFFKENQINVPIKEMMRPVIAALAEAQAELNLVDALIRNSELNAPADGIVVSIFRHKGCAVDIAEPILTVLHSDKTKVEAYVREKWLKNAVPGNKVKLTPFSNFYRSIPGKIIHVTNGVSKMPAEFLPVYEKQQLTGVRIVIELEEEWDGPAGAKFDIMF